MDIEELIGDIFRLGQEQASQPDVSYSKTIQVSASIFSEMAKKKASIVDYVRNAEKERDEARAKLAAMESQKLYSTDQYLECDKSKAPVVYYLPAVNGYRERVTLDEKTARHWSSHMAAKIVELVPVDKPAVAVPDGFNIERQDNHIVVTGPDKGQGVAYADETLYQLITAILAAAPSHSQQSALITEESAYAIIESFQFWNDYHFIDDMFVKWIDEEGRELLAKLSSDRCPSHESEQP